MRVRMIGAALAAALGLASAAAAQAPLSGVNKDPARVTGGDYVLSHEHGRVVWSVSHLGFSTFSGLLPDVQAKLTLDPKAVSNSRLEATVNLASVVTGLPAFDERLRGPTIFNTARFPTAVFRSTRIDRTGANRARVTGDLTFMGVTRPAVMDVTFNQSGVGPGKAYRIGFDGRMVIKRALWGLGGLDGIGDEVTLAIESDFVPPKP